jgi:hypothetical protein
VVLTNAPSDQHQTATPLCKFYDLETTARRHRMAHMNDFDFDFDFDFGFGFGFCFGFETLVTTMNDFGFPAVTANMYNYSIIYSQGHMQLIYHIIYSKNATQNIYLL